MGVTRSHADYSPDVIKMACNPAFMHERKHDRRRATKPVNIPPFIRFGLIASGVCRGRALGSLTPTSTGGNCKIFNHE
jgi:hypothetical protein